MTQTRIRAARFFIAIAMVISCAVAAANAWTPNAQEQEIANHLINDSGQHRAFLQLDPILAQVARARAEDMAKRAYFSHTNPDGHGANYLVRQAGYVLPGDYPADGNNIESIAAGEETADGTWSDWMNSPEHKTHLLGEDSFFAAQTSYGVGYYEDDSAPYIFYWVVITAPPMPSAATIAISSPASGAFVPEGTVTASGTATASQTIASVQISLANSNGNSAWTTVSGTQNWSATLSNVAPGANSLTARSLDSSGAVLAQSAVDFQYVVLRPLTINVVGQGSVAPFAGTTSRRVGVSYTITATPATGWLFSGWSGSWGGSQTTVSVEMREGLDTTATFVPNPFIAVRGMYSGLIGTESASHDSRGLLRVQLNAFGSVSGQLFSAGKGYAFLAQFNLAGRAHVAIPRDGASPLVLVLDMNGGSGALTATLIDGTATNTFSIGAVRQAGASLVALAGNYTVAFPAARANADPNVPAGDGYGVLNVDVSGAATLCAALADGTILSRGGWIASDGTFAFYAPLYAGGGELSGTLSFGNAAQSDFAGPLFWQKPQLASAARFANSFDTTIATIGSRYTPPAAKQAVLAMSSANPNAQLVFGAGDISSQISQLAQIGTGDNITIATRTIRGITATLNSSNGTFGGSFTHPTSGAMTRFRGIILQKQNSGTGYFLGLDQSGYAALAPAQ